MRRWLLRILIALLVLAAGAFVGMHFVLRSDLPRRIVLDTLRDETGLVIDASSLKTGWSGRTVIRDFTVTLPLEQTPFLLADELRIEHTTLIPLLLFRAVDIHSVEIHRPDVTIQPDASDAWNVLRAAEIIAAAQTEKPPDPAALDRLPRLRMTEATIHIAGPDGTLHTHDPITVEGDPIGALAWEFNIDYAPAVRLRGRIAPRADWQHHLSFDFAQVRDLIQPWLPDAPGDLAVAGQWDGRITEAELHGTLQLDDLRADQFHAHGDADVEVPGQRLLLSPRNLAMSIDEVDIPPVQLHGGIIDTDGTELTINRLQLSLGKTHAQVNGGWSRTEEYGHVRIRWSGREQAGTLAHEGVIDARLELPSVGRRSISSTIEVNADSAHGEMDARLLVTAKGRNWSQMTGSLIAERLLWRRGEDQLDLSGMTAQIDAHLPRIAVTQLRDRRGQLAASGEYHLDRGTWSLDAQARNWTPPARLPWLSPQPIDLDLAADGSMREIAIERLHVVEDQLSLTASGRYVFDQVHPLQLDADLASRLPLREGQPLACTVRSSLHVSGSIEPLNLDVAGVMNLDDVAFADRDLRPIELEWNGTVDHERLTFDASSIEVFGGMFTASGEYEIGTRNARLTVEGTDAHLERLAEVVELPVEIRGRAEASAELTLPELDLGRLEIDGEWKASELEGAGLLEARGEGRLTVRGPFLRIHDMQLVHEAGEIVGEASMRLDDPDHAHVDVRCHHWPIGLPEYDLSGTLNGALALDVNLNHLDVRGDFDVLLNVDRAGLPLGQFDLLGTISNRTLALERLQIEAFEGVAVGEGRVVLSSNDWSSSELEMEWSDINLAALASHWPDAEPLSGTASGTMRIARSSDPRAHEPMACTLSTRIAAGRFGEMHLNGVELTGFLGPERLIITDTNILAADGDVSFTARFTRHDGEPHAHVHTRFERLNLEQIAHLLQVTDDPMPGTIAGQFSGGGYLRAPHRLFGRADITLTESDLIGLPGFSQLYSVLKLDLSPQPTGAGDVSVRLEGESVEISRITYFNRGTDVVARLRVEDVRQGKDSPITGLAAGTMRPLRDIDLPFIGQLDRLFSAVQTGSASVRIGGTLQEPVADVVPLAEVTGALRRILGGRIDE